MGGGGKGTKTGLFGKYNIDHEFWGTVGTEGVHILLGRLRSRGDPRVKDWEGDIT